MHVLWEIYDLVELVLLGVMRRLIVHERLPLGNGRATLTAVLRRQLIAELLRLRSVLVGGVGWSLGQVGIAPLMLLLLLVLFLNFERCLYCLPKGLYF